MPMYSFRCPACGHRFEELLSISRKDEAVCPNCGEKVQRVWSGKCAFGQKRASAASECACGGEGNCQGGCTGNCACCAGCGK